MGFEYDKEIGLSTGNYKNLILQIIKISKNNFLKFTGFYKVIEGSEK